MTCTRVILPLMLVFLVLPATVLGDSFEDPGYMEHYPVPQVTVPDLTTNETIEYQETNDTVDTQQTTEIIEPQETNEAIDTQLTNETIATQQANGTIEQRRGSTISQEPYVILPSDMPRYIDANYVNLHGNSFILGGDWTGTAANGWAIWIAAPNVTFDGNNHTLTGATPNNNPFWFGVYSTAGNAVIKNIKTTNWYDGIIIANTNGGRIENSISWGNKMGVDINHASNVDVISCQANSNTDSGIFLTSSSDNRITGNTANGNTKIGINVQDNSNNNQVRSNTVNDNPDVGILVFINSNNNTIEGNTALRNLNNGLEIYTTGNRVMGNTFGNNHGGIFLAGAESNEIYNNNLINNRDGGLITYDNGVATRYNTIRNNLISGTLSQGGSSQYVGIILWTRSSQNTFKSNTIINNNIGIQLHGTTTNSFYDNYFRNQLHNTFFELTTTGNTWNVAASPGPNIVHGPSIGGNYWATPAGTGFSETCADTNGDGFCDNYYQISTGQIDILPLVEYDYETTYENIGTFKDGTFVLDYDGNYGWDGPNTDKIFMWTTTGWTPLVGDWNGDGKAELGTFKDGTFVLDYDGNYGWDGPNTDKLFMWTTTGWTPLVGDWNGDGNAELGTFKDGTFVLDYDGNYGWDGPNTDKLFMWTTTGWTPLVGDWNGDGKADLGTFKDGTFVLDYDGNYGWDGPNTDKIFMWTTTGWTPLVGDWDI